MASRLYEILRKDVFSDIETGPWVLSAPDEPHGVLMNLAIRDSAVVTNEAHMIACTAHWLSETSHGASDGHFIKGGLCMGSGG